MSDATDPETREEDENAVDPMIGRVLGSRYRVEALLGKGAMGAVYRARHVKVGRSFAVKVLHERLLADPKLRKRFEREAELAGKLHHINVIGVVDVGETEDGIHFMVMEFAEGSTLGALVDGPMDSKRVINIAQQLCDGLQHAHEHGLIHRDFKPENVIVEKDRFGNERPRIVDFGIAILRDDAEDPHKKDRLTTAGLVLGTPHYMAPEHAMGAGIDHRIDLFALGVIMYELLTGWLPFDGDGVDVARANLIAPTPPMGVRVPGVVVDPLLEAFTRQLMEKKPADRPESAKAARHLLDLIERDRPMAATILGVELAEPPPAPSRAAAPTPEGKPAHAPIDPQTPFAYRPTFASTPSTRADTVPERGAGAHTAPSSLSMGAIPSQSIEPLPSRSRWPLIAAMGGALGIAAVIVVMATRSPSASDETHHAARPEDADVVTTNVLDAAAVADLVQSDAMLAPEGSATTSIDPPPDAPAAGSSQVKKPTLPSKPTKPAAKPTKPTTTPTAAPPDTSASAVANLYGQVGRELKALDTKRGAEISQPMWQRFRVLRINDALTTPEKRVAAEHVLAQLRRDIAAAM